MDAFRTLLGRWLVPAAMVPLLVVVSACGAQPAQSPAPPTTSAAQPTTTPQADSTVTVTAQADSTVAATSADPATGLVDSTMAATAADTAGLVPAEYPQCDVGAQILRYLQTGDNGGDPQLDVQFANYVGVPVAQARALADQYIQQCDQQAATQESSQAYAESVSLSAASESAARAQQGAAIAAQEQKSCAAIGGRVDPQWGWCASTVPGDPSGQPGADCANASVSFNLDDGTLADYSYTTAKDVYPGCFR